MLLHCKLHCSILPNHRHNLNTNAMVRPTSQSGSEENWRLPHYVLLTEAAEKQTALLFVNQTSALAGRWILSTQPLKC